MQKNTTSNQALSQQASSYQSQRPPLFSPFGVVALTITLVISFFISQLIGVYIAGSLWLAAADSSSVANTIIIGSGNGTVVSVSIIISMLLLIALSMLILRLKKGDVQEYLALRSFNMKIAIAMFGLLILFMIASQLLTYVLDANPLVFVDPLYQSVSSVWLFVFAIVIAAPIYEELVFRGLLWTAIAEQFPVSSHLDQRGAIIASIVTSFIFAMIHLQYGVYEISTIVVLALIFSYARYKSGSLLLPIILHVINNGVAMGLYLSQVG